MLLPAQLSEAVGAVQVTTLPQTPAALAEVILAGRPTIVGFSVSLIVTVKLHEVLFPAASVTSNVLVVVPTGKVAPEANPAV